MDPNEIMASLEAAKENATSFADINKIDYIIKMVSLGMGYNRRSLEVFRMTKLAIKHELYKRGLLTMDVGEAIDEVKL